MQETPEFKDTVSFHTVYDDVFRTLLNDCPRLIIPLINEAFGLCFHGDEKISFSPNEHFINRQDGEEVKRITDASFTIQGEFSKKFLIECQSTPDSSMLVRMFEYAFQIALDQGKISGNSLIVEMPYSAVLFLRSTRFTPEKLQIYLHTPGGKVAVDIIVIQMQGYSLNDIFEKNLLFLIPFFIFVHERKLPEYNSDEKKLALLTGEYIAIAEYLERLQERGKLSVYYKKCILEMTARVLDKLASKYEKVRREVRKVLGGQVLDYEAKQIFTEGKVEGKAEGLLDGERIGEMRVKRSTARNLSAAGLEQTAIARFLDTSVEEVEGWLSE